MNQLRYGTKVELEHKPTFNFIKKYVKKHGKVPANSVIAKMIAKNHLAEKKNYYTLVKKYKL